MVHGYLCASQQTSIADKGPQHKEHGITEHTTGCRNVLVVVLYIVEGIVFFPVYTLPSERYLMVFLSCGVPRLCLPLLVTGNLSDMPAVLLIDCFLYCAHTCMYMYMSACIAPIPASVVPPQLLQICLNVMYLMQRLVANSWLEFTAGHCEAPQRHSRNLSIANVSYHGPDKTSSTSSRSQRVTGAHAVSPV